MTAVTYGALPADARAAPAGKPASRVAKPFRTRLWEAFVEARLRQARRELELHRHLLPAELQDVLTRGPMKTNP